VTHHTKGSDFRPKPPQNIWQRLAARTGGFITPANFITLTGLSLSLFGIAQVYNGTFFAGIVAISVGRLADILDGYVAKATGTTSRVGEVLDASADKLVITTAVIVLIISQYVPLAPLVLILTQNILNISFIALARRHGHLLHPSVAGKHAAVTQWLTIMAFVASQAVAEQSRVSHLAVIGLDIVGYISLATFLVLGATATFGYARAALDRRITPRS
jgi:phosphatidylglycerophosphate synthase